MKTAKLLGALLAVGLASSACKKDQESLIVLALSADSGASTLTSLTLSAQTASAGGTSTTFTIGGLSSNAVSYGLYIPSDLVGDVTVTAVAKDLATCISYTGKTTPAVVVPAAGAVVQGAIALRAGANPCQGQDAGTTTGQLCTTTTGTGLAGCNECFLHASTSCSLGATDDIPVVTLAFSPDGRTLVTGAAGAAKSWTFNGSTPVPGQTLPGTGFATVAFSKDGSLLAVGWKGTIEIWNVSSSPWSKQQTLSLSSSSNQTYDVGFSPDGQQVISIDFNSTSLAGNLNVHGLTSPAALQRISLNVPYALAVSPVAVSGGSLAAVADQNGQVSVYTVSATSIGTPTVLTATSAGTTAYAVRFSPDGTLLASGGATDGLVHFWKVPVTSTTPVAPDIDIINATTGFSDDVAGVAFSADGQTLAVGAGFFGSVSTWNVGGRSLLDLNELPSYDVDAIAMSATGMIAAGETDCGVVMVCP